MTWVSGLPHQSRTCSAVTGPRGLLEPGQPTGAEDGGVLEVDVQHHLAPASRAAAGRSASGEVEGLLAAGEVADGDRAAYVEGVGRAEQQLLVGVGGDRGLEVERVGQVEVAVDADPAR